MTKQLIILLISFVLTPFVCAQVTPPVNQSNTTAGASDHLRQKYHGLWDGQAFQNGTPTDIALNFVTLQDGSFVGEIQIKATKQAARFTSASVKADGSIVFGLTVANGSTRTHSGSLDASGQKMTGTYVHALGSQSVTGTFTAVKRATAPTTPKMTDAEIAQANAAADKAETELAQSLKKTTDNVSGLQIFSDKYIGADIAAADCVKKFPASARCYEMRGRLWAAKERDRDLMIQNLQNPNPPNYFKLATDDFSKAIALEPASKYFYLVRGKFFIEASLAKPELAVTDAEAALKIDPNYAPAKALLADAQKKKVTK